MQSEIIIPASGSFMETGGNLCLTIVSTTLPFTVVFNGSGSGESAQSGQIFDRRKRRGFRYANFINPNNTAITVIYVVDRVPASVQQSQKPAATRAVGNATTSMTNGQTLVVQDGNNGNQRQQITITLGMVGTSSLQVLDASGNVYDTVGASQTKTYVLNGTVTLKAVGNITSMSVGENYYNS